MGEALVRLYDDIKAYHGNTAREDDIDRRLSSDTVHVGSVSTIGLLLEYTR